MSTAVKVYPNQSKSMVKSVLPEFSQQPTNSAFTTGQIQAKTVQEKPVNERNFTVKPCSQPWSQCQSNSPDHLSFCASQLSLNKSEFSLSKHVKSWSQTQSNWSETFQLKSQCRKCLQGPSNVSKESCLRPIRTNQTWERRRVVMWCPNKLEVNCIYMQLWRGNLSLSRPWQFMYLWACLQKYTFPYPNLVLQRSILVLSERGI